MRQHTFTNRAECEAALQAPRVVVHIIHPARAAASRSSCDSPQCLSQALTSTPVVSPVPCLPYPVTQPGSQHRDKAEPAGAVVGDKWVPKVGAMTLTGPPRAPYCRDLNATA